MIRLPHLQKRLFKDWDVIFIDQKPFEMPIEMNDFFTDCRD